MKAFTDLEQSKKLAEILPLESADMSYRPYGKEGGITDHEATLLPFRYVSWIGAPCWSLAALLGVIPDVSLNSFKDGTWNAAMEHDGKMIYADKDDPVDACYELIIKLKDMNLLEDYTKQIVCINHFNILWKN